MTLYHCKGCNRYYYKPLPWPFAQRHMLPKSIEDEHRWDECLGPATQVIDPVVLAALRIGGIEAVTAIIGKVVW